MEELKRRLKKHEGFRAKPYSCPAGHLTIGYGHNLTYGITESQASDILEGDIYYASDKLMTLPWVSHLNEPRRGVCVELIFWLGFTNFRKFKNMIRAIERDDFDAAAAEILDSGIGRDYTPRARVLADIMRRGTL